MADLPETEHIPTLASVVLVRLRDFARRPVAEQARLSAQLEAVLAVLLHDIPARDRIVLEGSGLAAVAILNNPLAALGFAERALCANDIGMALSIGIDHGAVEIAASDSGNTLTGDGVATAAITSAFAADFGLLVSRNFLTALFAARPGAEAHLLPAGRFSDAGLRSYQLFRIDRNARWLRARRFMLIAAVTAIALLGTSIGVRLGVPERPRPLASYFEQTVAPLFGRIPGFRHGTP